MNLTAAAMSFLLTCSPNVSTATMAGLIEHESGWNQYAIGDNTAKRSYHPGSYWEAVSLARDLRARGHDIDAGLAQINDSNWRAYGLDEYTVFEPCSNVRVGATILGRAYVGAIATFNDPQIALVHALSAYNSGHYYAALGYANDVIANARNVRFLQDQPLPDIVEATSGAIAPATSPTMLRAITRPLALQARRPAPSPAQHDQSLRESTQVLTWALPVRSKEMATTP